MNHIDLHSGHPLWLLRNGLLFDYPRLDRSLNTDVIILGGGISGALMAHTLTERGISAVVIDARSIGVGSTCASTGLLQYEIDTPLVKLRNLVGETHAFRSYELCAESIDQISKISKQIGFDGFQFRKSLYYAAYAKDAAWLKEEYILRKEGGFEVQYLERGDLETVYGFGAPGAILSKKAGEIDAYAFTHALYRYASKKGLLVFDRTKVAAIAHHNSGVRVETADGHILQGRKIVYATGYEAVNQVDKKFVRLHSTYAVASEQENAHKEFWKDNCVIWNTAEPYLYMRTSQDNRVVVGGRDVPFLNAKRRDGLLGYKAKHLAKDFNRIFPHQEFRIEFCWAGTFGITQDGLPFIGPYQNLKNSYFALGYGGNGITFSMIAANIVSDLIEGKKNKDASIFAFNRI